MAGTSKKREAGHDEFGKVFQRRGGNQSRWQLAGEDQVDLEAGNVFFVDDTDDTKRVKFNVAGVTTATDRVLTVPDYDYSPGSTAGQRRAVRLASTALTLTDAMSGSLVVMDGASQAIVLPAATASNIGVFYDFIWQTTSTAHTITAGAGDILHGGVTIMSTGAGVENDAFSANGSSDLVFTTNGTTKGGIIGSQVRFTIWSATAWLVHGNLIGSGTLVTPFS